LWRRWIHRIVITPQLVLIVIVFANFYQRSLAALAWQADVPLKLVVTQPATVCGRSSAAWDVNRKEECKAPVKTKKVFSYHFIPTQFLCEYSFHSHSIVPGGLLVTSNTTRFTSRTSLVILVEIFSRVS
jgi:hypothetical protein